MNRIRRSIVGLGFGKSVFWRFLLAFLLLVSILMTFLNIAYQKSLQITTEQVLESERMREHLGSDMLEQELKVMLSVPGTLGNLPQFRRIRLLSLTDGLPARYANDMTVIRSALFAQCVALEYADFAFIYFQRSGLCVSTSTLYSIGDDCDGLFAQSAVYTSTTADSLARILRGELPPISYLPAENISLEGYKAQPYITVLVHPPHSSTVFCFYLRSNALLGQVHLAGDTDSYTTLTDGSGVLLADMGRPPEEGTLRHIVSFAGEQFGLCITESIADSHVQGALEPLRATNLRNLLLILFFSLAVSILLSVYSYLPTRKLARTIVSPGEGPVCGGNEYEAILRTYRSAMDGLDELNREVTARNEALVHSILIRLLANGAVDVQEREFLLAHVPGLVTPFRVAAASLFPTVESEVQNAYNRARTLSQLRELLPEAFACLDVAPDTTVLLLEDRATDAEPLTRRVDDSLPILFGVSEPLTDIGNLALAFAQAQRQALRPDSLFASPEPSAIFPVTPLDLSRLGSYISSESYHDIERFFQDILKRLSESPVPADVARLCYYAIGFTINSVLGDVSAPIASYVLASRPEEQFAVLQSAAVSAVEQMASTRDAQNDSFVEAVCLYIQEHLRDPNLAVDSIAEAMNISRSFLYKQLKDTKLNSIARYITEQRMELASSLLRDTDLPIAEISVMCGYSLLGTFTRVFKKTVGMQPFAYRKHCSSGLQ